MSLECPDLSAVTWRGWPLPLELHREIATLESDLASARTQNAILETLNRQYVKREAAEIEAARNWRDLCALMRKAAAAERESA